MMSWDHKVDLEHETAHIMESDWPSYLGQDGPASIRFNNPGAMWPGPSSKKFDAIGTRRLNDGLGQGNRIAIFTNAVNGAAALFDLVDRVYTGMTVKQAIAKWSGGNHVSSYLNVLQTHGGIDATEYITKAKLRDPAWALRFAKAMARHEAGREYPLTDAHWMEAHWMAFQLAPEDKPAKSAVAKTSQKHKAAGKAKGASAAMGLGAGGLAVASDTVSQAKTITDTVSQFLAQHGLFVLAVLGVVGFLIFQWFQDRIEKDHEDGRYEPSGGE
jgi:hypothetical protein